ncbi:hypothetical protein [Microcystis sp. M158S2]
MRSLSRSELKFLGEALLDFNNLSEFRKLVYESSY